MRWFSSTFILNADRSVVFNVVFWGTSADLQPGLIPVQGHAHELNIYNYMYVGLDRNKTF